ncbi:MAG: ComF family protein [Candidatus Margulisiibacteriota bacterium]
MWIDSFLDLIFPPSCDVCRKRSDRALCPSCFKQIKFMKPQFGINSAAVYDGVVREAIHRFKFEGRKRLAGPLGHLLVKYISELPNIDMREMHYIVPVPLHAKRFRKRGFNQAELLSNILSKYYSIPVFPILKRTIDTKPQFSLPIEHRGNNVRGAFQAGVERGKIEGKNLILFDDIYTTGATINECAGVLRKAGARKVEVVVLSRAAAD